MNFALILALVAGLGPHSLGPSTEDVLAPSPREAQLTRELQQQVALRVDSMTPSEQLSEYFGTTPGAGRSSSISGGGNAYSFDRFRSDPALDGFGRIETEWLLDEGFQEDSGTDETEAISADRLVEMKVWVARNLYLRGARPVTRDHVRQELERLRNARRQYENVYLFRGRSVVYASSNDRLDDGRPQFGRLPSQVAMRRDAGEFYFFRGQERQGPEFDVPELEELLRQKKNLTFVFEGHGRDSALKFDGKLTAKRLAKVLSERPLGFPPAIVVIDACRSHDFGRRLLESVRRLGGTPPIVVVPDEFGQSLLKEVFQSTFLRREIAVGPEASVGSILRSRRSRLSVYVPDSQQRPMQIG